MGYFLFQSLQEKDLPLLYRWFQEPTINQWYARGKHWSLDEIKKKYEPRVFGKEDVPSFIVYKNETPIGFIQYYRFENGFPEGIKDHRNLLFQHHDKDELVGIDLFIAEADMRGKGLGVKLIHQFTEAFLRQFSAIVVDPAVNNLKNPAYGRILDWLVNLIRKCLLRLNQCFSQTVLGHVINH